MRAFDKLPRLYTPNQQYKEELVLELSKEQAHYIRNVIRVKLGKQVRVFNGHDGEWLGTLIKCDRKIAQIELIKILQQQPKNPGKTHLLFPPIKKSRLDILIEKAVELGTTDFHPFVSQNTDIHSLKQDRVQAQIIEATEQSERYSLPKLHYQNPLSKLNIILENWNKDVVIYACLERIDAPALSEALAENALNTTHETYDKAFLIGPEGGFSMEEIQYLKTLNFVKPVSLGDRILRTETAAFYCLIKAS